MKKTYVRPMATFESFALCSTIAAGCADLSNVKVNSTDYHSCGFSQNGYPIYIFANSNCTSKPQDGDEDKFCYDVPSEYTRIFGS